jgi:hypothetical protein
MRRSPTNSRALLPLVATLVMALVSAAQSQPVMPGQATPGGEASLARNFYFVFDG